MTKPKAPGTSLLLLVLRGYSNWAEKAGYPKALSHTRALLATVAETVEGSGGRIISFDGDTITCAFHGLAFGGVPHAAAVGSALRRTLAVQLKSMKKVQALQGVTVTNVPKSRLR
ncbi:MAG: nucleotidyl cyclase domain-containing protein, partial [Planctomycetota bacterium]